MTLAQRFFTALSVAAVLFSIPASGFEAAVQDPIIDYRERFLPTAARNGMVVAPEKLAAEIGLDILRQGGNAVDAAVATGFALAVSYPRAGNLAGGGFMLVHLAEENRQLLIDYREMAPAAASRDMFIDENGEVDRMKEFFSHQSAGVPGTVAGLLHALDNYGTMSRAKVLAPAIALAKNGLEVSFSMNYELSARGERLRQNPEARRIFFQRNDAPVAMGSTLKQPDLAWTLGQISDRGRDGFYGGKVAQRITDDMAKNAGIMTADDLAGYQVIEREPVRGQFRDYEVISTPPPSSGGVHIIQMLNILQGYDLKSMGHNSAAYLHLLTESMKLAYADRGKYLGDPDFAEIPVAELIDPAYAVRQRELIDPAQATPSVQIEPGKMLHRESPDTTHYTVADRDGNVVSNTYTLNFSFGSHVVVPGTGMFLNNEMADFAARPGKTNAFGLVQGEPNKIEPRKRPLSSMSPTMVFRDGKPWLATGSPGGSVIITTVLQTVLNAMEFDMNIATAATAARVHHQWMPDKLHLENGVSTDTVRLLQAMGHTLEESGRTTGRTNSIMLRNGWLLGATDTRRPGGWVAAY